MKRLFTKLIKLAKWLPIIWRDEDWDHFYLLYMLEYKFRRMALSIGINGHTVGRWRSYRQLMVCATLCKRLGEDNYIDNASLSIPQCTRLYEHSIMMSKQDQEYLGKMISKYLTEWWD